MNKVELVATVAERMEVSKAEAGRIIDTVLGTVIEGAVKDGAAVIPGLGKLVVAETSARQGENFGVKWTKPAGKTIKLRLSKEGKELV